MPNQPLSLEDQWFYNQILNASQQSGMLPTQIGAQQALGTLGEGRLGLLDILSALASWSGMALPGRGGVGKPGRYPLGVQGFDAAMTDEGPISNIAKQDPKVVNANLESLFRPLIEAYLQRAKPGSAFKVLLGDNVPKMRARATPDIPAQEALGQVRDIWKWEE